VNFGFRNLPCNSAANRLIRFLNLHAGHSDVVTEEFIIELQAPIWGSRIEMQCKRMQKINETDVRCVCGVYKESYYVLSLSLNIHDL
jgi:hypothetical protein